MKKIAIVLTKTSEITQTYARNENNNTLKELNSCLTVQLAVMLHQFCGRVIMRAINQQNRYSLDKRFQKLAAYLHEQEKNPIFSSRFSTYLIREMKFIHAFTIL